jgi:hypothetical protein
MEPSASGCLPFHPAKTHSEERSSRHRSIIALDPSYMGWEMVSLAARNRQRTAKARSSPPALIVRAHHGGAGNRERYRSLASSSPSAATCLRSGT